MRIFYLKFLSLSCICAVFMVLGATNTFAFTTYGGGCVTCHPGFVGGFAGPLHSNHLTLTSDCMSCHLTIGDDPLTGYTPNSDTGTGCVGCHGRLEDAGNDSVPGGLGAGLRQHHDNAGISCMPCHTDSVVGNYTPVGEDLVPPFYPALGLDPCADGLDNDGELLYDEVDPDCSQSPDTDGDGVPDDVDNCPDTWQPNQTDSDGDGIGNWCDICPFDANNDADSDGFCGNEDNCPDTWQPNQTDSDSDGIGNWCDICPFDANNDEDSDGFCADADNCPAIANPNQENADNDANGDVCDTNTIYGTISGDVQAGVNVYIYIYSCGALQPYADVITDANGYYANGDIPDGRYFVGSEDPGYIFAPEGIWVDIPQAEIQPYNFTVTIPSP